MTKLSKTQVIILIAFIALNLVIFITLYQTFEIIPEPELKDQEIELEILEPVEQLLDQHQYDQAITKLQELLANEPGLSEAYLLLKDIYLKYDRKEDAIDLLNLAITNNISDDRILLALADIKYDKGDWESARDIYFLLYEKDPLNSDVVKKYANSLIVVNEDDKLKELSAKIDPYLSSDMRVYKNVLSYSFNMGEPELLKLGLEDLEGNEALMLQAMDNLSVDPAQTDSYILGLSQMVYELISNDYLELALHFDRKLIDENSFFEKPNLYAGSILMQLNSPEHALPHILRCLKYNPESIPCHILMVEHHYANLDQEKLESEIPMLLDLLSTNSQDQVFALLAIFDDNKDYVAVLKNAEKIMDKAPNYYREIDFLALKAALLSKDVENLEIYNRKVAQFELVLTASERAIFLSSKNILAMLENEALTSEQLELIQNIDEVSIYPHLFLYKYHMLNNDAEKAKNASSRALELDFDNDIPESYFIETPIL